MDFSIRIIADELIAAGYLVHKYPSQRSTIVDFSCQIPLETPFRVDCLYILDLQDVGMDLIENNPTNIVVCGGSPPDEQQEKANCLIEAPSGVLAPEVLQSLTKILTSFDAWERELLLAVLARTPVQRFLYLAAKKLTNPLALLDNGLSIMGTAGTFARATKGTIWDKVKGPGLILAEFYNVSELRDLSIKGKEKTGIPYLYHPEKDREHTYLSSPIWVDDILCGSIGMVDINAPFTGGQQDIIVIIIDNLKLYFRNNEPYMQAAANEASYFDSLLDDANPPREIIEYQLTQRKWSMNDGFRLLTFRNPTELHTRIDSLAFLKLIHNEFPQSIASLRGDSVYVAIRDADLDLDSSGQRKRLEKFLAEKELLCGVSLRVENFMNLHFSQVQSSFAVSLAEYKDGGRCRYYEDCQRKHIMIEVSKQANLRCFCEPAIVSLWDSGDEGQRILVRCLEAYLLHGRNIAATARVLNLHRNTLIYRMDKLSGILDLDLEALDEKKAFSYLFTCIATEFFAAQ